MNAEQFIKDHGLERARSVVEGAPESGQPLYFNTTNGVYLFTGYRNTYFVNGVWGTEDDHPSMQDQTFKAVSITHLKCLVESVDLIKEHYTLERAIKYANSPYTAPEVKQALERAIADYESIYGEE